MASAGRIQRAYCPLVASAPDVEASGEEGALDEVKEETELSNCQELKAWVLELEKSDMKNVPNITKRGSNGDWEINEKHPWVFEVRRCAEKVDEFYNSLKNKKSQEDKEGIVKYREIVQLKTKVSKLQEEIRGQLPDVCCPRSAWKQAAGTIGALILIGGMIAGAVFIYSLLPDEKEKG